MKTGWLLYDSGDYQNNRLFASHMHERGKAAELKTLDVMTEKLEFPLHALPDFVISRQRNHQLSAAFEQLGVPVFNAARVCEICNDKRNTHTFLTGLPMMKTEAVDSNHPNIQKPRQFPLVVKPAAGHGGDRVTLVHSQKHLDAALQTIIPQAALIQELASGAGKDLRVYVLFGKIIAAVMRTAENGIVSNFKRGGNVALHTLTTVETDLLYQVMNRFKEQGAPLSFAGIDLIYHHGSPVVNEVEDVVGSRMLYQVSDIDIIDLYIREIAGYLS